MNSFGGYIIAFGTLLAITEFLVILTIRFTAFDLIGFAIGVTLIYATLLETNLS